MDNHRWQNRDATFSSSSSSLPSSPTSLVLYEEEQGHQHLAMSFKSRKRLLKQLSMRETLGDIMWEKRRQQMLQQGQKVRNGAYEPDSDVITDEDLNELKGCIELGFRFKEGEEGQRLCSTLPALDLYFTINRQLSPNPVSMPQSITSSSSPSLVGSSSSLESPRSNADSWKIFSPGDNPQQVKTRLRHWAFSIIWINVSSSLFCEAIFLKNFLTKGFFSRGVRKKYDKSRNEGNKIQLGRRALMVVACNQPKQQEKNSPYVT